LIDWGYDYTNFENDNESEVEQKDNSKVTSGSCPTCGQKIDNETPF
jgi:hypothetical protein